MERAGSAVAGWVSLGTSLATGVLMATGAWALGLVDARSARIMALSGTLGSLAGAAFTSGTLALACSVGTASTGTAISVLSGAAATKAALAWLGGGAVAAGGWGMTAGTAFLTGGANAIMLGVGVGVHWFAKRMKEKERHRLIEGRIHLTMGLLSSQDPS